MFRSTMWALKNKTTGKFASYKKIYCAEGYEGDDMPFVYYSRNAARRAKDSKHSVVKVAVTVRKAA